MNIYNLILDKSKSSFGDILNNPTTELMRVIEEIDVMDFEGVTMEEYIELTKAIKNEDKQS